MTVKTSFAPQRAAAGFPDPAIVARLGDLGLVARTVVEGVINGLHRSPHLGSSMDFAEHRAYMPGDDIRRIDWKLFGRSDRHFVKEFEADTNTNFTVLLDVSRSMRWGGGPRTLSKIDYARHLAACLVYLASEQRDRVGLVTFDGAVREFVPPSAKHRDVILHVLDRLGAAAPNEPARGRAHDGPAAPRAALAPVLRVLGETFRRRAMVVLISDLYEEPEAVLDAVAQLRGRGNDLMVMHVLDRRELEFPFTDAASFVDVETGERIPVVPDSLRARYRALVQDHIASLRRLLGESRVDYALFDTTTPLDRALAAFLARRAAAAGARTTR